MLIILTMSSSLEKPQATQPGLWKPDSPRDLKHAGVNSQSSALGALLSPKHTCVLNEHVLGISPRREKCPWRVLAELQGGEWGCLQDTSGIANWPAGTSGLTHFPFKRGMSRSVELTLPGPARQANFACAQSPGWVKVIDELHSAGPNCPSPDHILPASSVAFGR